MSGTKINTAPIRRRLSRRRELLEQRVNEALDEAARVALRTAQGKAPGRIPQTLKARSTRGAVAGVVVSSSWPKAKFVENGTSPHPILPVKAKILRFEVNGQARFARRVQHPGTKAVGFMKAGREAGREVLRTLLERAIKGE